MQQEMVNISGVELKYFYIIPIVLYSCLIFYLSNQPRLPMPDLGILGWDKLIHFAAYFLYGILMQMAVIAVAVKKTQKNQIFIVILLCSLYAFSDEYHQSFVPGRDADIYDVLADLLGALTSLLLYKRIGQIVKRIQK